MLPLVHIFPCDSSFNDQPVNEAATGPLGKDLFEKEQEDLLSDLKDIPKKACDRKVSFPWSTTHIILIENGTCLCNMQL